MELLAPAGSLQSALAAIDAGANALFLGVNDLSHQRNQCANFSDAELRQVAAVAREREVKIYVTFNSTTSGDEFDDVMEKVGYLASIPIHGLIVADLGVVMKTHELYPDMKIMFSVQGECSNSEYAQLLADIGVHRIVVERNISIKEAARIKEKCGLEIEMFIFGYQCNSQDSICYMGDYWSGQPCNVHCAQKIRFLNVPGLEDPKRYLFMKYYSALRYIPRLAEAGIDGLKIEGRQRSSEYTYRVTKVFREAIDHYYSCKARGVTWRIAPEWEQELKRCSMNFEVTDGWFVTNDYQREVIEDPNLKTGAIYLADTIRTFMEGKNTETLRKELTSALRRATSRPVVQSHTQGQKFHGF